MEPQTLLLPVSLVPVPSEVSSGACAGGAQGLRQCVRENHLRRAIRSLGMTENPPLARFHVSCALALEGEPQRGWLSLLQPLPEGRRRCRSANPKKSVRIWRDVRLTHHQGGTFDAHQRRGVPIEMLWVSLPPSWLPFQRQELRQQYAKALHLALQRSQHS
jgi:hypothetical protein